MWLRGFSPPRRRGWHLPEARCCWSCRTTRCRRMATIQRTAKAAPRGWPVDAALQRAAGRSDAFNARHGGGHRTGDPLCRLPRPGPARYEPDGHRHVGCRLLAGLRSQRQPAQATHRGACQTQSHPGGAAHLSCDSADSRSWSAAPLRPLCARRTHTRLRDPAHRGLVAGRADLHGDRAADSGATADGRRGVGHHERRDGPDVDRSPESSSRPSASRQACNRSFRCSR